MTNEEANIQTVSRIYAAFGEGDIPTILNLLADDVDWLFQGSSEDVPFAGHFHGREEVAHFFRIVGETADPERFEPHEFIAKDAHVVVLGSERVRAKATGRIFETGWVHVVTLDAGKVVRVREFYDTAAMAAAFR